MKKKSRNLIVYISLFQVAISLAAIFFTLRSMNLVVLILLVINVLIYVVVRLVSEMDITKFDATLEDILHDRSLVKERLDELSVVSNRMNRIRKVVNACHEQATRQVYDSQAEYATLQSQINPHFLYNTLDSIRGQAIIDGNDEVAKMIEVLAIYFSYSVGREGEFVTLREELANIENYMAIHYYRFGDRYTLSIDIGVEDEKSYDALIPRLIIQPIVENAINHGLKEFVRDGRIWIIVTVVGTDILLKISDNGSGIEEDRLIAINKRLQSVRSSGTANISSERKDAGVALVNIEKRIQLLFGHQYGICVYSTPNAGTDVEVLIPHDQRSNHIV